MMARAALTAKLAAIFDVLDAPYFGLTYVITVTATLEELKEVINEVAGLKSIYDGARRNNKGEALFYMEVGRKQVPIANYGTGNYPNDRYHIRQHAYNEPDFGRNYKDISFYNLVTGKTVQLPRDMGDDPTIPKSNTNFSQRPVVEPTTPQYVIGESTPIPEYQRIENINTMQPFSPAPTPAAESPIDVDPSPEASEGPEGPDTPEPSATPVEPYIIEDRPARRQETIVDPYDNFRRRWDAREDDDESPSGGYNIDNVATETDHDRLAQHRAYTDYARPLILKWAAPMSVPIYDGADVIEAWVPALQKMDRVYVGFIAAKVIERCIMHSGLTDESPHIKNANAMARTWINAAFGIYEEDLIRDSPLSPLSRDPIKIKAGMTMIECETAILTAYSRTAQAWFEETYREAFNTYVKNNITAFIHTADVVIYTSTEKSRFLPRQFFVDSVLQQCMYDASTQFFVELAQHAPPNEREIPLRLYLSLPPGFYDVPFLQHDEAAEALVGVLRVQVQAHLKAGGRGRMDGEPAWKYARILGEDKMLRQNVEFSPLTQCAVPAPQFQFDDASGLIIPAPVEDENKFPVPEIVKWPLLHLRYVIQNSEFAVPHASWHNSRLARVLRWRAYIRMVFATLETPGLVGEDTKIYEWPSQFNIHDPINGNVSRHGVRMFPKYTYRALDGTLGGAKGTVDDNESVLTTIINMSYDRKLRSAWTPTPENPEVIIEPGEMHTYQRHPADGGDKNMRFLVMKRDKDEIAADTNPLPFMQCSLIVHKKKNANANSLTKWAVENGNILQVAGVFRSNLYKGSQSYTDRGDYVHFMIKPRAVIESSVNYPIFRDNRIFLQREAFYNVFNMPTVIAKPLSGENGARFAILYTARPAYSIKAYKDFSTQRTVLDSRTGSDMHELVFDFSEPQTPLKPTDAMFLAGVGANKEAFAREMAARQLIPDMLYPAYFPPTRSFFALQGFQDDYDQYILRDLLTVSEYEIARMMGAVKLDKTYIKRTPEVYAKFARRARVIESLVRRFNQ
jgi:hypothetical protein